MGTLAFFAAMASDLAGALGPRFLLCSTTTGCAATGMALPGAAPLFTLFFCPAPLREGIDEAAVRRSIFFCCVRQQQICCGKSSRKTCRLENKRENREETIIVDKF